MSRIKHSSLLCQVALSSLVTLSIASGVHAQDSVQVVSAQAVELLTGGVGERERQDLLDQATDYDVFVSFAVRDTGAYVSGVRVTLTGRTLVRPIEVTANGPLMLANLPAGDYLLTAELPGWKPRERHLQVERRAHQQLWVTFVSENDDTAAVDRHTR